MKPEQVLGFLTKYVDDTVKGMGALKGDKGDKGEQGIQGIQGDKGDAFTYSDFTQEQLEALKGEKGDKGDKGADGIEGYSPTVVENANNTEDSYKLDITTKTTSYTTPNLKGKQGDKGDTGLTGEKGADGVSPTVTVTKEGKIATITCTDINGTTISTIKDGEGSEGGEANVIESISVNGTHISIDENKNVDITVPSIDGLTKDEDLATVAKSGDYEDLINKPTIPDITGLATETWVNEQGFLTQHQDLSNYATKDELPSLDGYATETYVTEQISNIPSVDLTDYVKKNEIPDVSGYVTEEQLLAKDYADKAYVTEEIAKVSTGSEIDLSSYLSKVEATETYVTKENGKSLIADTEIERLASVDNYDDTYIRAELVNKADITDIPTVDVTKSYVDTELSKKADTDHTHITVNGHTVESDVPVDAKFTDTVYDDTNIKTEIAKKADTTSIPSKVSYLENDSKYQTESNVATTLTNYATKTYVGEQIANSEHLKREIVTVLPLDTEASDNIIYMLKVESATGNDKYQEYMKIDGTVKMVGDTSVDLTDYAKSVEIPTTVEELADSSSYAKKTDIPTSLPANGGNADTVNSHTIETDVPTDAVFTDTIYDDTEVKERIVELDTAVDNKSDKGHTHDDRYYTETEMNTKISMISDAYSSKKTYAVGEYCIYNDTLWKCLVACKGKTPTEGTYWTQVSIISELIALRQAISQGGGGMKALDYANKVQLNTTVYTTTKDGVVMGGIRNSNSPSLSYSNVIMDSRSYFIGAGTLIPVSTGTNLKTQSGNDTYTYFIPYKD